MAEAAPKDRMLTFVGLGLALAVVGALGNAGWTRYSLTSLSSATGRVVEVEQRAASVNARPQRVPVAEVSLAPGQAVRVPLESSSNSPFCCEVGEQVEVYFDPSDPARSAKADVLGDLYGPQLLVAAVAGLFLVAVRKAAG